MSSVICLSVPPGSNVVRKMATGICGVEFTVGNLSKASATAPVGTDLICWGNLVTGMAMWRSIATLRQRCVSRRPPEGADEPLRGRRPRRRRRARCVNVVAVPQFENEQLPQAQGMVATPGQVLLHQPFDEDGLEIPPLPRRR